MNRTDLGLIAGVLAVLYGLYSLKVALSGLPNQVDTVAGVVGVTLVVWGGALLELIRRKNQRRAVKPRDRPVTGVVLFGDQRLPVPPPPYPPPPPSFAAAAALPTGLASTAVAPAAQAAPSAPAKKAPATPPCPSCGRPLTWSTQHGELYCAAERRWASGAPMGAKPS